MSDNQKHIGSQEFKKYFSGSMPENEKADFETSFDKDSFEGEALEGFLSLEGDANINTHINSINNRVEKRAGISSVSTYALPWKKSLGIAASVLFLLAGTYFFATQISFDNKLAKNDETTTNVSSFDEDITAESVEIEAVSSDSGLNEQLDTAMTNLDMPELVNNKKVPQQAPIIMEPEISEEVNAPIEPVADLLAKEELDVESNGVVSEDIVGANNATFISDEESAPSTIVTTSKNRSAVSSEIEAMDDAAPSNFEIGKTNYQNQNYNAAIGYFQQSSSQNQEVIESEYYLGLSFYNLGKNNKAIKSFDNVIESNSALSPNAKWYKSIVLLEKGDESNAIKILEDLSNGNSGFKNQASDKLKSFD